MKFQSPERNLHWKIIRKYYITISLEKNLGLNNLQKERKKKTFNRNLFNRLCGKVDKSIKMYLIYISYLLTFQPTLKEYLKRIFRK